MNQEHIADTLLDLYPRCTSQPCQKDLLTPRIAGIPWNSGAAAASSLLRIPSCYFLISRESEAL